MRYRLGDNFFALAITGPESQYINEGPWPMMWLESEVRTDWPELVSLSGGWEVFFGGSYAVFSSRSINIPRRLIPRNRIGAIMVLFP